MSTENKIGCTVSPCLTLFIVFFVLQVTHVIDWSWWWITAPLWGPFAIAFAFIFFGLAIGFIGWLIVGIISLFWK